MFEMKVKDLVADLGLVISGVIIGLSLGVGLSGAPVKLGPIEIVKEIK